MGVRMNATNLAAVPELQESVQTMTSIDEVLRQHIDISKPYAVQRDEILEAFRRVYVELLLAHTNGNRSRAARIAQVERSHFTKLANRLNRQAGGSRDR